MHTDRPLVILGSCHFRKTDCAHAGSKESTLSVHMDTSGITAQTLNTYQSEACLLIFNFDSSSLCHITVNDLQESDLALHLKHIVQRPCNEMNIRTTFMNNLITPLNSFSGQPTSYRRAHQYILLYSNRSAYKESLLLPVTSTLTLSPISLSTYQRNLSPFDHQL